MEACFKNDHKRGIVFLLFFCCLGFYLSGENVTIQGEMKKWHKITFLVEGPERGENSNINPFLDYRLDVTFTIGERKIIVPGYFAADGNAAETGAESGKIWKVIFRPDEVGVWKYAVSFKNGDDIAIRSTDFPGEEIVPDGQSGTIEIISSDKESPDLRAKGRVRYVGERYLKYSEGDEYFIKNGADSPENFLAFYDFDQTYRYNINSEHRYGEANPDDGIHKYNAHIKDWNPGCPTWRDSKGKGIIGAINYLASKGINSIYMLTMNIHGDGNDVWPWNDYNERYRFDCSKLAQWEIVFDYMEEKGMMLHLVTQETENECLLDVGDTEVQRRLYYRELIARFGHHLAVTWNLGEENGYAKWTPIAQTEQQKRDMAEYIKTNDPYSNFVSIHTHSNTEGQDMHLKPLIGFEYLDGISWQESNVVHVHDKVSEYLKLSQNSSKQWVVCLDEIGGAHKGVLPDEVDPDHDTIRHRALWGALMAGAGGTEWYFGYKYAHNDLDCEDFRSRDLWWDQTRLALQFFKDYLPFHDMDVMNDLVDNNDAYCLAKSGDTYAIYFPEVTSSGMLDLKEAKGSFNVKWYNPRKLDSLRFGSTKSIRGEGVRELGSPPEDESKDWVCLITKM
ncbi:DUF5060 domain-containing protein [Membranihabitans maritimus]|uniref:DUF5060 domain-containing protein n=1 Tax=Membranihabitans maritimus TaxID=2904244 RepID=UPI001F449911|nr:DUF5060 domain-containing protein [Membranihabitans maritimus]